MKRVGRTIPVFISMTCLSWSLILKRYLQLR